MQYLLLIMGRVCMNTLDFSLSGCVCDLFYLLQRLSGGGKVKGHLSFLCSSSGVRFADLYPRMSK